MPPPTQVSPAHGSSGNFKSSAIKCEVEGCKNVPMTASREGRIICKHHENLERIAKQKSYSGPPPVSHRPISKAKLYSIKPEDKQYLKSDGNQGMKRKRVAPVKRTVSSGSNADDTNMPDFQRAAEVRKEPPLLPSLSARKTVQHPKPRRNRETSGLEASMSSAIPIQNRAPSPPRFNFASSIPPPSHPGLTKSNSDNLLPDIFREMRSQLQEDGPPSPEAVDATTDHVASGAFAPPVTNNQTIPLSSLLPSKGTYKSPYTRVGDKPVTESAQPSVSSQEDDHTLNDIGEDENLPNVESLSIDPSKKKASPTKDLQSPTPESPQKMATAGSSGNTSDEEETLTNIPRDGDASHISNAGSANPNPDDPNYDPDLDPNYGFLGPLPHPQSLEAKRRIRALTFDPTELDMYLAKSREPKPRLPPSAAELLHTQIWGHIDPRKAWPKKHDPEWLEAKRQEIEARPKRKENFGKVVTEQNLKERSENGYIVRQPKGGVSEEAKQLYLRLEEITGVKNLETDFDLTYRNGVHVFVEKEVVYDSDGNVVRRKKKSELRTVPIQ
ncbi:hypothetical protein G7Y89_g6183 [Cudoniella acicularis]|uniref:Uncharacterized protein n=1 Tax=Cudoniella acicularis TaxID=354080 RepID=A0A8H4W394_9HELO|nr:hypothetical protein G7Y89_g6183 [Cudoniella acicularis]